MGGLRLLAALLIVGCGDDSVAPPDAAPPDAAGGAIVARGVAHPDVVYLPTQLDAGSSTDSQGRALSYSWHFTKVPTGSTVTDAMIMTTGAGASFVPDLGGDYGVQLTASAGIDHASTGIDFTVPTVAMFHYAMVATADTSQLAPALVSSDGTGSHLVACGETLDAGTAHWDAGPSDMMNRLFFSAINRSLDVFAPDPMTMPTATPRIAYFEQASGHLLVADATGACPGTMPVRIDDPNVVGGAGWVHFSPDGNRVVYLEVIGGAPRSVITVGVDGNTRHTIRSQPAVDPQPHRVVPVWRDMQRLAWVEVPPGTQQQFSIMQGGDSDLPSVTELLTCNGVFAQIDQIGFPSTGEILLSARPPGGVFDLYREPIGGPCDATRKLTNEPIYSKAADFAIAPQGVMVAYWSAAGEAQVGIGQRQPGDIWVVPADGSALPQKLVGAMGLNDYQPRWVAGGRQLTWTRIPVGEGTPSSPTGLFIVKADGTGEHLVISDSAVQGDVQLRLGASNGGNACSGMPGALVGLECLVGIAAIAIALSVRGRAKRSSRASRCDRN